MERPELPDLVAALEARVAFLEAALRKETLDPASLGRERNGNSSTPPIIQVATNPVAMSPVPDAMQGSWELKIGLTWLNRAGAAAVVLALVFCALWAHDHGYLSPTLRTIVATGLSLASLFAGVRMSNSSSTATRVFSYGFQVIGSLGLYVVCLSAAHIDHLMTPGQALAAACLNTIALVAIAQHFKLHALANLAALGGLSVPLLTQSEHSHFAPLFVFLSLQAFLHLWIARKNRWGQVSLIQAIGLSGYFLYLASTARALHAASQCAAMTLVLGLFVCLYVRDELFSVGAREVDRVAAWISLAAALGCWSLVEGESSRLAPMLLLIGGSALLALAHLMHKHPQRPRTSGPALMGVLVLLVAGWVASGSLQLMVLAAPMSLLLLSYLRAEEPVWLSLRSLCLLAIPMASWLLCDEVLANDPSRAALLALIVALQFPLWRPGSTAHAHTLAVLSSHCLGALGVALWFRHASLGLHLSGQWGAVSVVPALYGLALLWLGRRFDDAWTRYTGLSFVGLCAVKVAILDVWSLSSGARVSVFLSLGVLLLGGSYLYSRSEAATSNP